MSNVISSKSGTNIRITRRAFLAAAGAAAIASSLPTSKVVKNLSLEKPNKNIEIEYKDTFCSMCGALCAIRLGISNGKIVSVSAIDGHPQTGPCGRAVSLMYLWNNPLRLKKPLKRKGERGEGKFEEVSWDQALDEIAAKLREIVQKHGFKAIAMTHHDIWSGYMPLFMYLFGTPNRVDHGGMCFGNGTVARRHTLGIEHHRAVDPDYENANYVLLIGRTISTASMGTAHNLLKNENVRVVVVDPRMPEIGYTNAEWVPIIPGTDAAFLYAMIHEIIENGWYDRDFLTRFTNAPFLIRPDGAPLVEADIREGGGRSVYLVYDTQAKALVDHTKATAPDLMYSGKVKLKDGSEIDVKTAFVLLRERVAKYPPSEASKIAGVPESTIKRIAKEFSAARGVADDTWYVAKNGVEYDVVRLVLILNALVGNIDKRGGLCFRESQGFPSFISVRTVDGKRVAETVYGARMPAEMFGDVEATRVDRVRYPETVSTFDEVFNGIISGEPYPIRALFIIGSSPMVREMNTSKVIEAYKKLDLLVVIDVLPQDDVDYADYVLPDTTFLERNEITDVKWTLHAATHLQNKVLDPPPNVEARDALWIMFEIGRRAFPERAAALGWKEEYKDYSLYQTEFLKKFDEAVIAGLARSWGRDPAQLKKELEEKHTVIFKRKEFEVRPYRTSLPTPSGKVEIYSIRAFQNKMDPLPDVRHPHYTLPKEDNEFYLINGKGPFVSVHAALMEPMRWMIDRRIWMNPRDASRLGIKDGDEIEIEAIDSGVKARARVRVTDRVRERVLFVYAQVGGRMSKLLPPDHFAREGVNPNSLCLARPTPIAGGGASNSSVRVRKL